MPKKSKKSSSSIYDFPLKIVIGLKNGLMYILGKLAWLFMIAIIFSFLVALVANKLGQYPLITLIDNIGLMFTALVAALTSGNIATIGSVIVDILLYFGFSIVQILQLSLQITFQAIGNGIYSLLGQTGDIHLTDVFAGVGGDLYFSITNLGFYASVSNFLGFSIQVAFTTAGGSDKSSQVLLYFNPTGVVNMLSLKFGASFGGDVSIPSTLLSLGINSKIGDYLGSNNTFTVSLPSFITDTKFGVTVGDILTPLQLTSISVPVPSVITTPFNDLIDILNSILGLSTPRACVVGVCTPSVSIRSLAGTAGIDTTLPTLPSSFDYSLPQTFLDLGLKTSINDIFSSLGLSPSFSVQIPSFIANIGINITIQDILSAVGWTQYTFTLPTISFTVPTLSIGDLLTGLTASAPTDWYKVIQSITG